MTYLKQHRIDIALLQETHLTDAEHVKLKRGGYSQVFYSSFTSRGRGVAILINKSTPFQLTSTTKDKGGRYIIIRGSIYSQPITLVNIYAPNHDDPQFFRDLFFNIASPPNETFIGGDFNLVLDPTLDRSSSRQMVLTQATKALKSELKNFGLCDIWRTQNQRLREYSFYSPVHNSYSRIDLFLVPAAIAHTIPPCEYLARTISDHSGLIITIPTTVPPGSPSRWRFNSYLLNDPEFVEYISNHLEVFFETNQDSASPEMVWESMKAYIRGQIICYTSGKRKIYKSKVEFLEREISALQREHVLTQNNDVQQKLRSKQLEYNTITTHKTENAMRRMNQRYYEQSDKAGKLLAWQIRREEARREIHTIKSGPVLTANPKEINTTFKNFYETLYTSQGNFPEETKRFLDKYNFQRLSEDAREALERDMTEDELKEAISKISPGKSPGLDGFTIEFFKAFLSKLIKPLLLMYNHAYATGKLPDSLELALITVLPKPGKDLNLCSSYRPISILSTDYKIFSKMLSLRLEKHIPNLIHMDQTGFIQGRSSFDNVRRLFNIINASKAVDSPIIAVSLDAEKAFDRVEWPYLFEVMKRMNFGPTYSKLVAMLYRRPMAQIQTNNDISSKILLSRSTRQGCGLSPLLFALAIEPLAVAIRSHPSIKGKQISEETHTISLYADDILLYLTEPEVSVPALLETLDEYSAISGYKINFTKSVVMPLNPAGENLPRHYIPFQWDSKKITYLGLQISNTLSKVFSLNYSSLLSKTEEELNRWMTLPLSLIGRVNSIKMNILPKFLYLFQMLPIAVPKTFFKQLNSAISRFIWGKKTPRIKLETIQGSHEDGGLKLPNFQTYYWAAQARAVWVWQADLQQPPSWLQMEQQDLNSMSLASVLYVPSFRQLRTLTNNPFILLAYKIWSEVRKKTGSSLPIYDLTPFHANPLLPEALRDGVTQSWFRKGIQSFGDLYKDGELDSFRGLRDRYDLDGRHFFKFMQIRHYIQTEQGGRLLPITKQPLDKMLHSKKEVKGLVSYAYSHISRLLGARVLPVRGKWEADLNYTFDDDEWADLCEKALHFSFNTRHLLTQFKMMHRTYYTPERLNRISPTISQYCPRCKTGVGSLLHMFWSCSLLSNYWDEVLRNVSKITEITLPFEPRLVLLGDTSMLPGQCNRRTVRFIRIALITAIKCIALKWKDEHPPPPSLWLKELTSCVPSEKIMYNLRQRPDIFEGIWRKLIDFVEELEMND